MAAGSETPVGWIITFYVKMRNSEAGFRTGWQKSVPESGRISS